MLIYYGIARFNPTSINSGPSDIIFTDCIASDAAPAGVVAKAIEGF